jgi:hypothetical protein
MALAGIMRRKSAICHTIGGSIKKLVLGMSHFAASPKLEVASSTVQSSGPSPP